MTDKVTFLVLATAMVVAAWVAVMWHLFV